MKHEVDGNARAGAAETGLAVHGQRAGRGLDQLDELPRDRQRRRRAVGEEELVVRDALSSTGGVNARVDFALKNNKKKSVFVK